MLQGRKQQEIRMNNFLPYVGPVEFFLTVRKMKHYFFNIFTENEKLLMF